MHRPTSSKTKAEEIDEFLTACTALENCKYIVSDAKMRELFKTIADSTYVYDMIKYTLYDFDYAGTFDECVATGAFILPQDPKKAVALTFRLLWDIDAGRIQMLRFLEKYYSALPVSDAFTEFCADVVRPFKSYCCMLLSASDAPRPSTQRLDRNEAYAAAVANGASASTAPVAKTKAMYRSDALNGISSLANIGNSILTGSIDRDEFAACLNGLLRALNGDNYDDVVSSLLGVKFAAAYFFKASTEVNEIYKALEQSVKHLRD